MKNLHDLKSFHENALNEWNATALIMKEAMKGETDTRKTFMEVVIALSDMAGKDINKRRNLIKAGHIVLHSMSEGKLPQTPPPLPPEPTKKVDRWKGVRRVFLTLLVVLLCAGSFAGGMALNTPNVLAKLPGIVTEQIPTSSPEHVIQQLMAAIIRNDKAAVIALYHPEQRKDLSSYQIDFVDDFQRYTKDAAHPLTAKVESVQENATAKALVTISYIDRAETATVRLSKFENQWYLVQFDI